MLSSNTVCHRHGALRHAPAPPKRCPLPASSSRTWQGHSASPSPSLSPASHNSSLDQVAASADTTLTPAPADQQAHGLGRRMFSMSLLAGAAVSLAAVPTPALAGEPGTNPVPPNPVLLPPAETTDPNQFLYNFASDLPSNLRPREYWLTIIRSRPGAWQQIAQCIQGKKFEQLSLACTQNPFADLRSATLYMPWALLQVNEYEAAIAVRKASVAFEEHVQDLQRIALAASENPAQIDSVQQAFILLNASLENFISAVPAKYQQASRSERAG